jgi:hypothetical protein
VTLEELQRALTEINTKYEGNIEFTHPQRKGTGFQLRLQVKDSRGKGARRGSTGRRMINACWHVHGDFFDALLKIQPKAVIKAGQRTISIAGGNWEDWNIGSLMNPLYYSEACDCNKTEQ